MAAVLHPHHVPSERRTPRPDLRVLPGGGSVRPVPARPGLSVGAALASLLLLVVVVAAVIGVGRGAFAGLAPAPPAATAPGSPAGPSIAAGSGPTVKVVAGDTLWSIARRLQPTGDVRPLVDQLMAAHGSARVMPGDRITLAR